MRKPELAALKLSNPLHLLALGFGSGLSPVMPGTMGTLAAIPLYLLVQGLPLWAYLGLLVLGFVAGIKICEAATRAIGRHDHGAIVWDEIIGFGITMIAAPAGWGWIAAGFVLFRFFDIAKPWPIRWFDRRVHGGVGIMLDDVIAGLFALACLQGLAAFL
ncbi:phosphatidylglycerophosphatase A [Zobellella denitrificans]|uniref:Phosphatidylglycerophosphatase A n=1 Tax=Zobellella denitrificans TaxID=347534 RepID=A0A231N1P0_9GAMM|nr:phosphatidylglycerophosphatase A [Zobellella denitrificans]ATG73160.1 phosphatidylglycerophosphatase [Zobellella denitrificans]OXS16401.1 phosphatidylglycerophosphatase A [Zobellella denitrificans]